MRAVQAKTPIFPLKTSDIESRAKPKDPGIRSGGFTLIEVMVVLAIITAIVTMVMPRIGNQNNELKATIRRFSVLTREIRHRARLENATYRLVIDMKDGSKSGKNRPEYWIEKSASQVLLRSSDEETEIEKDEEGHPIDPDGFAVDDSIMPKKELPKPLFFEDVELVGQDRPVDAGKVFIHFFPEGLIQEAAIHFRMGEKAQWTLGFNPITGKADIITQRISLKDIRDQ